MEFDHRDPARKLFAISSGMKHSRAALLAEIAKCDVVCANCHRVRTAQQREAGLINNGLPRAVYTVPPRSRGGGPRTPYEPHADVEAAALMFNVAPGTIGYWASLYKVTSIPDPGHPRRRLYHLGQLQAAAQSQAAKRQARRKPTP